MFIFIFSSQQKSRPSLNVRSFWKANAIPENMDTASLIEEDSFIGDYDGEHDLVIDLEENSSDTLPDNNSGNRLNSRKIYCAHCPKTFSQASNYKTHLKVHGLGEQFYVCTICGRDFQYKNSFQIHIATHSEGIRKNGLLINIIQLSIQIGPSESYQIAL